MKKQVPLLKITRNRMVLAVFLLGLHVENVFPENISPENVSVIVNPANTQLTLSQTGLNAIFNMRLRQWNDGNLITVFVLEDENPLHKTFCKQKLHVFPHQIRRGWNRLVFSGTGQAPLRVDSKEDMLKQVSSTPGAIGYLSSQDLTADVKVLEIK